MPVKEAARGEMLRRHESQLERARKQNSWQATEQVRDLGSREFPGPEQLRGLSTGSYLHIYPGLSALNDVGDQVNE